MAQNNEKTTEFNKTEILTNLLWTEFGIIGGISYYSKSEYLICGIMVLIGILYAYKLIKLWVGKWKKYILGILKKKDVG